MQNYTGFLLATINRIGSYFKPEYNINFVENFPDENHKGYRQYFDLDYNALCVEIDLEFDGLNWVQLYSDTNRVNTSFDFIEYKLYNDNNRLSMYDIFKKKIKKIQVSYGNI